MFINSASRIMMLPILLASFLLCIHGITSEVIAEPKFSGPIPNQTVAVGRDAVLICMVEDLGAYKVAWLRVDTQKILTIQNHVITKNHRISILHSEHKTWQLKIKDIRESDRGFYMCQINVDPMKSQTGYLDVVAEPKFSGPIPNQTVAVGRDAVLICMVEDLGAYKVAWLRVDTQKILTIQNHVITKNHRISILHSEHKTWQLKIKDIRESDRGFYMCQINVDPMKSQTGYLDVVDVGFGNSCAIFSVFQVDKLKLSSRHTKCHGDCEEERKLRVKTTAISLRPQVPPDILDFPTSTDMVVNENSNITLICEAKGPTANHPAGGNFESILNESTYKTDMTLRIKSVGPNDFGSYKCIAKNSLGETDSTIKLYKIPKNTLNSIETQEKPYRGKARKGSSNYESNEIADDDPENAKDLMRDERNGHSIKISSKACRLYALSMQCMAFISTLVTLLMLWRTTSSL